MEEELENLENVSVRMRQEGFDYCFRHYSNFSEVKDERFHILREAYKRAAEDLENHVHSRISELREEL
jgi:hypothetical protein